MSRSLEAHPLDQIPERPRSVAREAAAALRAELGEDTRVIWYGSWPRGDAQERSDIDLAVDRDPPLTDMELVRARDRLEGLRTLYSLDLVGLSEAGDRLRTEIEREGAEL